MLPLFSRKMSSEEQAVVVVVKRERNDEEDQTECCVCLEPFAVTTVHEQVTSETYRTRVFPFSCEPFKHAICLHCFQGLSKSVCPICRAPDSTHNFFTAEFADHLVQLADVVPEDYIPQSVRIRFAALPSQFFPGENVMLLCVLRYVQLHGDISVLNSHLRDGVGWIRHPWANPNHEFLIDFPSGRFDRGELSAYLYRLARMLESTIQCWERLKRSRRTDWWRYVEFASIAANQGRLSKKERCMREIRFLTTICVEISGLIQVVHDWPDLFEPSEVY